MGANGIRRVDGRLSALAGFHTYQTMPVASVAPLPSQFHPLIAMLVQDRYGTAPR